MALKPHKITMVIEVVPSPRLDIEREAGHEMPKVGRAVDDGLLFEAINDAAHYIEIQASSLAFNVSPEDLFLLGGEAMESLLSGAQQTVVVDLFSHSADATSDCERDAQQQDRTKVRLTFIPVLQHAKSIHDGVRREENNRHDDSDCDTISERLLKKLEKWFYKAFKAHRD